MDREQIIRAWKDEGYRSALSAAQRTSLPANPAGLIELPDDALGEIAAAEEAATFGSLCGAVTRILCDSWIFRVTVGCCNLL